jgi:RNA polymerase sigma-70 factor (ECF subfamily)
MEAADSILEAAIAGDRGALEQLLREASPVVERAISNKIDERHRGQVEANDVMQVTYMEAFLRIGCFVPSRPGAFTVWLRRIAENNLVDAIRHEESVKRRIQPLVRSSATSDAETTLFAELKSPDTTPSRNVTQEEARNAVRSAMKSLPPDYARALQLFDIEGNSGREVAEIMGRREGAVRMLRARARELMAEKLGTFSRYL